MWEPEEATEILYSVLWFNDWSSGVIKGRKSQFGFPRNRPPRQGFGSKWFIWEVLSRSVSRELGKWAREETEASKSALSRELLLWTPGAQSPEGTRGNSPHTSEFSYPKGRGAGILSHPSLPGSCFLETFIVLHPQLTLSGPSLLTEPEKMPQVFTRRGEPWGHRRGGRQWQHVLKGIAQNWTRTQVSWRWPGLFTLTLGHLPAGAQTRSE